MVIKYRMFIIYSITVATYTTVLDNSLSESEPHKSYITKHKQIGTYIKIDFEYTYCQISKVSYWRCVELLQEFSPDSGNVV